MRDSTHGKGGFWWFLFSTMRWLCSRRGAAAGRGAMLACAMVLFSIIAATVWYGPGLAREFYGRFAAMERAIYDVQRDMAALRGVVDYRTANRDRQIEGLDRDVTALERIAFDHERRIYRLEGGRP